MKNQKKFPPKLLPITAESPAIYDPYYETQENKKLCNNRDSITV